MIDWDVTRALVESDGPSNSYLLGPSTFGEPRSGRLAIVPPPPSDSSASGDSASEDSASEGLPSSGLPSSQLSALAQLRAPRPARRFAQLLLGLALYGLTLALLIRSTLGNAPWDVLHQGMSVHLPLSIGMCVILASVLVLACWVPLKERPGVGTLANALLIGLFLDLSFVPVTGG